MPSLRLEHLSQIISEKRTAGPRFRDRSGEHTRPRVCCSASRRAEFSGETLRQPQDGDACAPQTLPNISETFYENRSNLSKVAHDGSDSRMVRQTPSTTSRSNV